MKRRLIFIILYFILLVAIGAGAYVLGYNHHKKSNSVAITVQKPSHSANKNLISKTTKPTPSYYIGDSQTDGNIVMTLDGTSGAATMAQLPSGYTMFNVNITVKNIGSTPFMSQSAFVNKSSIYTQVGSNTSTGQYITATTTPCFGGGKVIIAPNQTINGCIQFAVPKNALVDTFFYDNLKWYL